MRFAKGHGTGNDFLILPDPDGVMEVPPDLVARLCDRRTGLGADGILRVVRARAVGDAVPGGAVPGGAVPGDAAGSAGAADWFMDYRNADGSVAEMCGNGIRVFARYLLDHGLAEGPELAVATRAGLRLVRAEPGGEYTVDMGAPAVGGHAAAEIGSGKYEGLAVSLGNPHLACVVDRPVAEFDLTAAPAVDHGEFPDGVNVEVVRILGEGHLEMRVHERGSGETMSCGTGAVAAAVAAATATQAAATATQAMATATQATATAAEGARNGARGGGTAPGAEPSGSNGQSWLTGVWTVQVPGGTLTVTLTPTTSLLTGPAVIVAEGELSQSWLAAQTLATATA
jgi:diaminopimelate epimerase